MVYVSEEISTFSKKKSKLIDNNITICYFKIIFN